MVKNVGIVETQTVEPLDIHKDMETKERSICPKGNDMKKTNQATIKTPKKKENATANLFRHWSSQLAKDKIPVAKRILP